MSLDLHVLAGLAKQGDAFDLGRRLAQPVDHLRRRRAPHHPSTLRLLASVRPLCAKVPFQHEQDVVTNTRSSRNYPAALPVLD